MLQQSNKNLELIELRDKIVNTPGLNLINIVQSFGDTKTEMMFIECIIKGLAPSRLKNVLLLGDEQFCILTQNAIDYLSNILQNATPRKKLKRFRFF
jgi:hypothetical protein